MYFFILIFNFFIFIYFFILFLFFLFLFNFIFILFFFILFQVYQDKLSSLRDQSRQIAPKFFERLDFLHEEKKKLIAETEQYTPQKTTKKEKRLRPEEKIQVAQERKDQGNKHFGNFFFY